MDTNLVREFARSDLPLEIPRSPITPANRDIFQMDVRREASREWFRLWRGHEENVIRVADADRRRRQVVLLVQERNRTFLQRLRKTNLTRDALRAMLERDRVRLVRETDREWVLERETSSSLRRFLCGMDEQHLFIAQFEGGTGVRDAHRLLKPAAVREAERSGCGRVRRQGEWFFVPLGALESRLLANELAARPYVLHRREALGGNGRPHVAEETARLEGDRLFARGAVVHPDHKTLVLRDWHRVHRNAEVRQETAGANGIYWID